MPSILSSNSAFSSTNVDVSQANAGFNKMTVKGLKPNTKHLLYIGGVDYSWAAKQIGKDLADDLISDSSGVLVFGFLFEDSYEGSYAFDNQINNENTSASLSQSTSDNTNYIRNTLLVELKGSGSYAKINLPSHMYVNQGHTNRSDNIHGH